MGLKDICASESRFPDSNTFYRWMIQNPALRELYARSKEDQTQLIEDEMLSIADRANIRGQHDCVERSKLQIETRKWLMGKLKPKKYGEKQTLEHSGEVTVKRVVSDI